MGQVDITFPKLSPFTEQEKWFKVTSDYRETAASGAFCVKLAVTGPGRDVCPACSLFLGECPPVQYEDSTYHSTCVECATCGKDLYKEQIWIRESAHQFYCYKDFEIKFGTEKAEKFRAAESARRAMDKAIPVDEPKEQNRKSVNLRKLQSIRNVTKGLASDK